MRAICIPAFNRPALLQSTLRGIERAGLNGWTVFVLVDGNGFEVSGFVAPVPICILKNSYQMGCSWNSFLVCHWAFSKGAKSILFMDDDILLSPDALQLCDWYLSIHRDPSDLGLCLCRKETNDPSRPNSISVTDIYQGHFGQGWCFTREMWLEFILRKWWAQGDKAHDWILCAEAQNHGKRVYRPRLARAKHDGAVGYHGTGIGVFPDVISDGTHRNYVIES